jgi:hypothetical protein
MSAVLSVKQATGASPTYTTITNLRHNTDDTANPGTSNPLVKQPFGNGYGFWKSICLNVDVAPATLINNIKFYTPGSLAGWTGVTLFGNGASAYTEASGTAGFIGDQLTVGIYAGLYGAPVDLTGFVAASPLSVAGSLVNINDKSDFVVLQAIVSTGASAGTLPAVTFAFRYDES